MIADRESPRPTEDGARGRRFGPLFLLSSVGLYPLLVAFVAVPFVAHNELLRWDNPGHEFSIWYIREHLFPHPTGWNPFFFLGFPQGTLYPPLFHYLGACLAHVVSTSAAMKTLVLTGILATPVSFRYFAESFGVDRERSSLASLLMTLILVAPITFATNNNWVGGTFGSTFLVGLVTSGFALPLFFFYAGAATRSLRDGRITGPALLLATIVLTHSITSVAAALYLVFVMGTAVVRRRSVVPLFAHGVLAALLTCFWALPFVVFLQYSDSVYLPLDLGVGSFLLLVSGIALVVSLYLRGRLAGSRVLAAWFFLVTIAVLAANQLDIPFHFYRLVLFPVLAVPVFAVLALPPRTHIVLGAIALSALAFYLAKGNPTGARDRTAGRLARDLEIVGLPSEGRSWIIANPSEQIDMHCPHALQHEMPRRLGMLAVKGLFVESSANSRYLLQLERLIDPWALAWGVPMIRIPELNRRTRESIVNNHLRNFGITSLVSARTLGEVETRGRRPLARTRAPWAVWTVDVDSVRTIPIPSWHEKTYFVETEAGPLVFVEVHVERARFELYEPDRPLTGETTLRLVLEDRTAYARRIDREIWEIDFVLEEDRDATAGLSSVDVLRREVQRLPESLPGRERLLWIVGHVEDDLHEASAEAARAAYADAPEIVAEHVGRREHRFRDQPVGWQLREIALDALRLGDAPLVEALDYEPRAESGDWDGAALEWFLSSESSRVIVRAEEPLTNPGGADARITDLEVSARGDRISFTIDAEEPALALIRVSHFPKWRATRNGEPIPIHVASPHMMLVRAAGDVELRYETLPFERVCAGASLLTLVGLIGWGTARRVRKRTR